MTEPLDHLARLALPWRDGPDLTECGKPVADVAGRVVSRETVAARIKKVGQKRAAFETCMTCVSTSNRWTRTGGVIEALAREAGHVAHANPPRDGFPNDRWQRRQRLTVELEAVAALVAAHRDEFDGYLAGLGETVSLADRRRRRDRGVS